MRKKILAANWKMNLTQPEVTEWLQAYNIIDWNMHHAELRVYPSAIYLQNFKDLTLHVGAQNVNAAASGAFTGEHSIQQLLSVGAQSVLIGHSERRQLFGENDTVIHQKVRACATNALPFVLCCGEPLLLREQQRHVTYVLEQIGSSLSGLGADQLDLLVVAYEPIWAIGTGLSANIAQITEMHQAIRTYLCSLFGQAAQSVPVLYGGSVDPSNAAAIFGCPDVDGALVGGAALQVHSFYQLWLALQS